MPQTSTGNVLRDLQNELSEVQNNHSTVITAKGRRFSEIAGVSTGSQREHGSCHLVQCLGYSSAWRDLLIHIGT